MARVESPTRRKRLPKAVPQTAPSTQRGRETRERLKSAMLRLLQRHTFHEIRLEDIARAAGVQTPLIYHYFNSKVDLTFEILKETIGNFEESVHAAVEGKSALEAIHAANLAMILLYAQYPGVMRCLVEVQTQEAQFSQFWRDATRRWNQRIAKSIARRFPGVLPTQNQYLALAYALAGMVDNFLYEYFVHANASLREAHGSNEELAQFLSLLWYRALYAANPDPAAFPDLAAYAQLRAASATG